MHKSLSLFTETFFSLPPDADKQSNQQEAAQCVENELYQNIPAAYMTDAWLDTNSAGFHLTDVADIALENQNNPKKQKSLSQLLDNFQNSTEYKNILIQLQQLGTALDQWTIQQNIPQEYAQCWITLTDKIKLGRGIFLKRGADAIHWLSKGKQALEQLYFILQHDQIIPLEQKKIFIESFLKSQGLAQCPAGVLTNVENTLLALQRNWPMRLMSIRTNVIQQYAVVFYDKANNFAHWSQRERTAWATHFICYFVNGVTEPFAIPKSTDTAVERNKQSLFFGTSEKELPDLLIKFKNQILKSVTFNTIIDAIVADCMLLLDKLGNKPNSMTSKVVTDSLNALGPDANFSVEGFFYDSTTNEEGYEAYHKRQPIALQFALQCTLLQRLANAGYLAANALQAIPLANGNTFMYVQGASDYSWLVSTNAIVSLKTVTPLPAYLRYIASTDHYVQFLKDKDKPGLIQACNNNITGFSIGIAICLFAIFGMIAYLISIPLTHGASLGILPDLIANTKLLYWLTIAVPAALSVIFTGFSILFAYQVTFFHGLEQFVDDITATPDATIAIPATATIPATAEPPVTEQDNIHTVIGETSFEPLHATIPETGTTRDHKANQHADPDTNNESSEDLYLSLSSE